MKLLLFNSFGQKHAISYGYKSIYVCMCVCVIIRKHPRLRVGEETWGPGTTLPRTSCVTPGQWLALSEPLFPCWKCEGTKTLFQSRWGDHGRREPRAMPRWGLQGDPQVCAGPTSAAPLPIGPGHPGASARRAPEDLQGALPAETDSPMREAAPFLILISSPCLPVKECCGPSWQMSQPRHHAESGCGMTSLDHQSTERWPALIPERIHQRFPAHPSPSSKLPQGKGRRESFHGKEGDSVDTRRSPGSQCGQCPWAGPLPLWALVSLPYVQYKGAKKWTQTKRKENQTLPAREICLWVIQP